MHEARHKPGVWLEGRATLKLSGSAKARHKRQVDESSSPARSYRRHRTHRRRARKQRRRSTPELARWSQQQQQQQQPLTAHLYVDSLSSEDDGIYLCRVDFRRARSRIQEFALRIVGEWPALVSAAIFCDLTR